jgi:polysaccharide biosynthesis protein PslG
MRVDPDCADLGEKRRLRRRRWAVVATAALAAAIGAGLLISGVASRHRSAPPSEPIKVAVSPPAKPPPSGERFGVNVNRLFNDRAYTQQQIDAQLQALRGTGATIARSDALWEVTEVQPPIGGVHRYDWAFDDTVAGSLAAHDIRWLPIIDYSAPWARSTPGKLHSPPRSASDYGAYAAAFAARYGLGGSFWSARPDLAAEPVDTYEIWNEPDNPGFWSPTPRPTAYADLYLSARDAIDGVDPAARVIVGGLTHPQCFLPEMVRVRPELRGEIDGVAIHPYGPSPAGVLRNIRIARLALRSIGMGATPLYLTEFGWTAHPSGAPSAVRESPRPGYIFRSLAALGHLDCGVAAVVLYTWVTPESNPAHREDSYGIHPPNGGTTPDTIAFAHGLKEAAGHSPALMLCGVG